MLDALIAKLNFKAQEKVLILQAPAEFQPAILHWKKLTAIDTAIHAKSRYPFAMVFVHSEADVKKHGLPLVKQLEDDAVFWMVYPKKTSKKYAASITRDQGWSLLGDLGFEPVRMVAVDDDWSALRFRKTVHIGKMTRGGGKKS